MLSLLNVLLPYRFTLFSNMKKIKDIKYDVLLPYRFTLFSNACEASCNYGMFYYLIDLHYSQTSRSSLHQAVRFTTL